MADSGGLKSVSVTAERSVNESAIATRSGIPERTRAGEGRLQRIGDRHYEVDLAFFAC